MNTLEQLKELKEEEIEEQHKKELEAQRTDDKTFFEQQMNKLIQIEEIINEEMLIKLNLKQKINNIKDTKNNLELDIIIKNKRKLKTVTARKEQYKLITFPLNKELRQLELDLTEISFNIKVTWKIYERIAIDLKKRC